MSSIHSKSQLPGITFSAHGAAGMAEAGIREGDGLQQRVWIALHCLRQATAVVDSQRMTNTRRDTVCGTTSR